MELTIFWEKFWKKMDSNKSDSRCRDHKICELDILPTHENEQILLEEAFTKVVIFGDDKFWKMNKSGEDANVKISPF